MERLAGSCGARRCGRSTANGSLHAGAGAGAGRAGEHARGRLRIWDYQDVGYHRERCQYGRPAYAQERLSDIRAFPVPDLALPDAHVYIWMPNAFVLLRGHGARLLEELELPPPALITWVKTNVVTGAHFMGQTSSWSSAQSSRIKPLMRDVIYSEGDGGHSSRRRGGLPAD